MDFTDDTDHRRVNHEFPPICGRSEIEGQIETQVGHGETLDREMTVMDFGGRR